MSILDDILAARDLIDPPIYYALHPAVTPGKALRFNGDAMYPPFLLLHPDDFETVKAQAPARRWVQLRDWRPTPAQISAMFAMPA